nr:testis expressed protein 56 isoform X2 [Pan troglodytes]
MPSQKFCVTPLRCCLTSTSCFRITWWRCFIPTRGKRTRKNWLYHAVVTVPLAIQSSYSRLQQSKPQVSVTGTPKRRKAFPTGIAENRHAYNRARKNSSFLARNEFCGIKKNGENPELSGLERILARHQLPKEINLTPKPNRMPPWKRKIINNVTDRWKKCHLLKRNTKEPPMSTIVVRWLKKNMQPTEDLKSVICRLSAFGPIQSVTVCGHQSAIVAFKDMTSACNAVSAFQSRTPGTMFQCSWQQQFMSKDENHSAFWVYQNLPEIHKL